jgi:hypothetical protein
MTREYPKLSAEYGVDRSGLQNKGGLGSLRFKGLYEEERLKNERLMQRVKTEETRKEMKEIDDKESEEREERRGEERKGKTSEATSQSPSQSKVKSG